VTPPPRRVGQSLAGRSHAAWHRRVWRLSGPIILSNLSIPLMGAVDTAVMGHLPDPAYIGAVALAATVFNFVYWSLGFLRMGTTGFAAQALGAGDPLEVRAALFRPLLIAGAIGIVFILVQIPIGKAAFWLLGGGSDVTALAKRYYAIRIWSAPAAFANYVLSGWLLGMQRARATMALQVALNGINAVLAILFVIGLGWGISGVASATLTAEWLSVAIGFGLAWHPLKDAHTERRLSLIYLLDRTALASLFRVNGNIFLRTIGLLFAFSYFTRLGARMGDLTLAANSVLMQFQAFMAYGLDGFANAASAIVGSAVGSRDGDQFRQAVRVTTIWAAGVALLASLAYLLIGRDLIDLMTNQASVRDAAEHYLPWMIASPLVSFWCFQLDGIFLGATSTVEMRNAMVVSVTAFLASTLIFIPLWGNHGLWLSLLIFMAARGATLGAYYPRLARRIAARGGGSHGTLPGANRT
jgi:multidrug resistance protein, MATE family